MRHASDPTEPRLGLAGLTFRDLFHAQGLQRLDDEFLTRLKARDPARHAALLAYRASDNTLGALAVSELLLACGPLLDEFVAELFGIQSEADRLRAATRAHDPVFAFKKQFVQKRAKRRLLAADDLDDFAALDAWLDRELAHANLQAISTNSPSPASAGGEAEAGKGPVDLFPAERAHRILVRPGGNKGRGLHHNDRELAVARHAEALLADVEANKDAIEQLTRWCIRALTTAEGRARVAGWASFRLPQPTQHQQLVPLSALAGDPLGRVQGPSAHARRRDGFALTDARMGGRAVQNEVNYCIYCHDHDGDFCSKGFPEKKGEPAKGLKTNPLGVTLTGCPLDEKISEMHSLKRDGAAIAALAMAMVDNPMVPATGHRICNDCMKACIYQKQDPVDIPQIETRCLTDVLQLPWGVEIYDLLTRWNPLRARQWLPKPYSGCKVLIAGLGPAGFTLAHHLLMEGLAVVGIEGLKIEPLPESLVAGPIRDYRVLEEALDARVMTGFGGVAEYGITNRWDKNFLKLIYLSLVRRPRFQVFGGVRFGGTVTVEDAWHLGFDHLAICIGAGLPQALPIPGSLAPGMRQANDFLMALQLTGAAKRESLANLQVRLPAVVIGGGLTGIDTATEVQAYYIAQVEKLLARYEALAATKGEAGVRAGLDTGALRILDEFLAHGRAVRVERARAQTAAERPDFQTLLRQWGGVTIVYRKGMNQSPAYTRNHEEIVKAFEEGIFYAEGLDPKEARVDGDGQVEALVARRLAPDADGKWVDSGAEVGIPARAILVATGARPNVAYEFEHKGHFAKERGHYRTFHDVNGALAPIPVAAHCKLDDTGPFTSYDVNDRRVSFLGDTHPVFHGSVVKAIASGLRSYPKIVDALGAKTGARGRPEEYLGFRARIQELLQARVQSVTRLSPSAVELTVRAPLAARRFRPGQFFRLQNFETQAPLVDGTRLQTETLALTGAKVDADAGTVSLIVVELGASSRLVAMLRPGEPVVLMGPTGVRTTIPEGGETVMVVGGRRGAAHIRAVGPALRAKGNRVLYIAGFPSAAEVFCRDDLEAAADAILWVTEHGAPLTPRRPQDRALTAPLLEAIRRYAEDRPPIPLQDIDRLLVIGSNRLVRLMRDARRHELRDYLVKSPHTVASISTPMQCCLKGVCSQCLQWQIDPHTGRRTKAVFACSWQDQPLDIVDLDNLDERLSQNRVQEHITNQWLEYLLAKHPLARV